jgi:hypothetical protein
VRVPVYNQIAEQTPGARPLFLAAVISVHRMNTLGPWQKNINTALQDNFIRHTPVDYGYQRRRAFRPFTRGLLREVTQLIVEASRDHQRWELRTSAIGHSFGTLSIGTAMQWNPDLILNRIITFGSILRHDFPWRTLFDRGQMQRVRNEFCQSDPWVRRARFCIAGAGDSGCRGFHAEPFIDQTGYDWTGHSLLGTPLHCQQTWVPFILAR